MSEIIKARMQQKSSKHQEWDTVKGFTPLSGEVIVHSKEENIPTRVQIGDGVSKIEDLDFITGEVYTHPQEPTGAKEGALWIGIEGAEGEGELEDTRPDWSSNEDLIGHIKNRPFWLKKERKKITFANPLDQSEDTFHVAEFYPLYFEEIEWETLSVTLPDGRKYEGIPKERQFFYTQDAYEQTTDNGLCYLNGSILKDASNSHYIALKNEGEYILLCCFRGINLFSSVVSALKSGTYFFIDKNMGGTYIESVEFFYQAIQKKSEYESILKKQDEVRIFRISDFVESNIMQQIENSDDPPTIQTLAAGVLTELGQRDLGDVILLPKKWLDLVER